MKDPINTDNLYKTGTIICAVENPSLKLVITNYLQRIYYCAEVAHPENNRFAYFERELIPPGGSGSNPV